MFIVCGLVVGLNPLDAEIVPVQFEVSADDFEEVFVLLFASISGHFQKYSLILPPPPSPPYEIESPPSASIIPSPYITA